MRDFNHAKPPMWLPRCVEKGDRVKVVAIDERDAYSAYSAVVGLVGTIGSITDDVGSEFIPEPGPQLDDLREQLGVSESAEAEPLALYFLGATYERVEDENIARGDGPRAFAAANEHEMQMGMSLRDYFAGQALAGLLASAYHHPSSSGRPPINFTVLADDAYTMADDMLKARGG